MSFCEGCVLESLGDRCFMNSSLCQIVIPSSVTWLPDECFFGCTHLEDVVFENGSVLRSIGPSCFEKCMSLRVFLLPNCVERLQRRAFHDTRIASLAFPSSVIELGESCFPHSLSEISPLCSTGIRDLSAWCFSSSQLKTIEIPAKVLSIGSGSFDGCVCLASVSFEDEPHLQVIGEKAFRGTGISAIDIPDSVQSIRAEAFCETSLCEICLPRCLRELGNRAFANCRHLKSVRFHDECVIRNIQGENVFDGTHGCHITLAPNAHQIHGCFLPDGCDVSIPQGNKWFSCDSQFIFNIRRTRLVRCFRSTSCVIVPKHVQCIGECCFR